MSTQITRLAKSSLQDYLEKRGISDDEMQAARKRTQEAVDTYNLRELYPESTSDVILADESFVISDEGLDPELDDKCDWFK